MTERRIGKQTSRGPITLVLHTQMSDVKQKNSNGMESNTEVE